MLIQKVNFKNINKTQSSKFEGRTYTKPLMPDSVKISAIKEPEIFTRRGKEIRVLSFGGVNDPFRTEVPKLRFGPDEINRGAVGELINKDYEKGYKLKFKLIENGERKIQIFLPLKEYNLLPMPEIRHFGYAPKAIVDNFFDDIKQHPKDFEISVFKTFKNSKYALLNLDYVGKDQIYAKKVNKTIDELFSDEVLRKIEAEDKKKEIYQVVYHPPPPKPKTKEEKEKEALLEKLRGGDNTGVMPKNNRQKTNNKNLLGIRTGIEDTLDYKTNLEEFIRANPKKGFKLKFRVVDDYSPKSINRDDPRSVEIYYEAQDIGELPFKEHTPKVIGHIAKSHVREFYDEIKENPQDFQVVLDTAFKNLKNKKKKRNRPEKSSNNEKKEQAKKPEKEIKEGNVEIHYPLASGFLNPGAKLHGILKGIEQSKKAQSQAERAENKYEYHVHMDIEYINKDPDKQEKIREKVSKIIYKNQTSPQEILEKILDYKKVLNGNVEGTKMIQETRMAIKEITKTLQDPNNKKVLILGHNNPDGDTAGSALGLKYALEIYGGKEKIDVGINDVLVGLLRRMPGSDEIKRTKEFLSENDIQEYLDKHSEISPHEKVLLKKTHKSIMENTPLLDENEEYDVVIMLDIAGPEMLNKHFKKYLEKAKKVIYIDHHPDSFKEWQGAKGQTGFDVDKTKTNHLYWVEKKVPAAAMMTTIIVNKLLPHFSKIARGWKFKKYYSEENKDNAFKMSSALSTGITTDTGGYRTTFNIQVEDTKLPNGVKKPNFSPKGMVTWLMALTEGQLSIFRLRKQMDFFLPKKTDFYINKNDDGLVGLEYAEGTVLDESDLDDFDELEGFDMADIAEGSPHQKVIELVEKNTTINRDIKLAIVKADYDEIYDLWKYAGQFSDDIILKDAANALKYTPTFRNYRTKGVAVCIRQEDKKGFLNTKYQIANSNKFTFSFRSPRGTNHANLISLMFNGGGHDPASGGRLELEGLDFDTKLAVKIDGKIEDDNTKVLEALKHNYDVEKFIRRGELKDIQVIKAVGENGRNIEELISDMVREIRQK